MNSRPLKSLTAVAVAAALTAAGCASAPDRPERQLARAEAGIEFAEQNDAGEYGAAALERARQHLDVARREADAGEYEAALEAAEKAELDAELAAAQATTRKAGEALAEIRESIETLRREIARYDVS